MLTGTFTFFRHDVSWGTKGSDKAEALPSVSSKKAAGEGPSVVEDVERVQEDIDAAFKETVTRAVAPLVVKETVEKPTMDVSQYHFAYPVKSRARVYSSLCFTFRTKIRRSEPAWSRSGCLPMPRWCSLSPPRTALAIRLLRSKRRSITTSHSSSGVPSASPWFGSSG